MSFIRVCKNKGDAVVTISDLRGQVIPAHDQKDLGMLYSLEALKASDDLLGYIADGTLVLNIGDGDLSVADALRVLLQTIPPMRYEPDKEATVVKIQSHMYNSKSELFSIHFTSGGEAVDTESQVWAVAMSQTYDSETRKTVVDFQIPYDPSLELSGCLVGLGPGVEFKDMLQIYIWHPSYGPGVNLGDMIRSCVFSEGERAVQLGEMLVSATEIPLGLKLRLIWYDHSQSGKQVSFRVFGWCE